MQLCKLFNTDETGKKNGTSIYPKGLKRTQKDPKETQKDPEGIT